MKSSKGRMKAIERKFAYAFCILRILVDLSAVVIGTLVFFTYLEDAKAAGVFGLCIAAYLACILLMGVDFYYIYRDIRHIRSTNPDRKETLEKKNKIEL